MRGIKAIEGRLVLPWQLCIPRKVSTLRRYALQMAAVDGHFNHLISSSISCIDEETMNEVEEGTEDLADCFKENSILSTGKVICGTSPPPTRYVCSNIPFLTGL